MYIYNCIYICIGNKVCVIRYNGENFPFFFFRAFLNLVTFLNFNEFTFVQQLLSFCFS